MVNFVLIANDACKCVQWQALLWRPAGRGAEFVCGRWLLRQMRVHSR